MEIRELARPVTTVVELSVFSCKTRSENWAQIRIASYSKDLSVVSLLGAPHTFSADDYKVEYEINFLYVWWHFRTTKGSVGYLRIRKQV
jgi:hypothetical protein